MRHNDDIEKKKEDTQWHKAFVVAIQVELIDCKDVLEYKPEHPWTTAKSQNEIFEAVARHYRLRRCRA